MRNQYQETNEAYIDDKISWKLNKDLLYGNHQKWENSKIADSLTADWGSYRFRRTAYASLAFTLPLVVGAVMTVAGGINSVGDAQAVEFCMNGMKMMQFGAFCLPVPIGVGTVSLGLKVYDRILKAKKERQKQAESIFALLDDLRSNSIDPSIAEASWIYRNCDLSRNSKKVNLQLLIALANYREAYLKNEDVDIAEKDMIDCFKSMMEQKGCSDELRNSAYLKSRIAIYDEDREQAKMDRESKQQIQQQKTAERNRRIVSFPGVQYAEESKNEELASGFHPFRR